MFRKREIVMMTILILLPLIFLFGRAIYKAEKDYFNATPLQKLALDIVKVPEAFKEQRLTLGRGGLRNPVPPAIVPEEWLGRSGFVGKGDTSQRYLLLSRYDGDASESVVELVDLKTFEVLHEWRPHLDDIALLLKNSTGDMSAFIRDNSTSHERLLYFHPLLLDDGHLVFNAKATRNGPMVRVDSCSNVVWVTDSHMAHHAIEQGPDGSLWSAGRIYLPDAETSIIRDYIAPAEWTKFSDDTLMNVSLDGEVVYEQSITDIFLQNGYLGRLLGRPYHANLDPFHLNDVEVVTAPTGPLIEGDLVVSSRSQSALFGIRPSTNEIIWTFDHGDMSMPHDIDFAESNWVSFFDNRTIRVGSQEVVADHNKIKKVNLTTGQVVELAPKLIEQLKPQAKTQGLHTILADGSLFIEETPRGRIIFIDENGELMWEYYNGASSGDIYTVKWSRLLHTEEQINLVETFLQTQKVCS